MLLDRALWEELLCLRDENVVHDALASGSVFGHWGIGGVRWDIYESHACVTVLMAEGGALPHGDGPGVGPGRRDWMGWGQGWKAAATG